MKRLLKKSNYYKQKSPSDWQGKVKSNLKGSFYLSLFFSVLFLFGGLSTNELLAQRPAPAETIETLFNSYEFNDNSGITAVAPYAFGASSTTSGTSNVFSAGFTGDLFLGDNYNVGAHFVAQDLDASPGNGGSDDAAFDWITVVPATTNDVWFSGIFFSRKQSTALFDTGDKLRVSYSTDGGITFINDVVSLEVKDAPLNYAGGKHYTFNLGALPAGGTVHIRVHFDNLNGGAEGVGVDDFKLYTKCGVQVSKRGYTICETETTYSAYIPYTGSTSAAMTVTPNAGAAAFDFNTAEGEIVISGIPVGTDWSIDVAGGCESVTISGLSPAICFESTVCPATPTPPANGITITSCLTEASAAAQDALAFADPTGATPFGTWSGSQGAVAYARANNLTDISFETGYYNRGTWGGWNEHSLDIEGLNVYGNGSTIDGNGDGGTMQECFAIIAANNITFYDLHIRDYMHTGGGAIQIGGQTGIKFVRVIFDANDYGSDGVVISGGEAEFYCCQLINHVHEPGLGTSSAMSITGGTVKFIETDWSCNRRVGFGGALKITNSPIISFYNGTFSDNYTFSGNAGDGGGFYMGGGDLYIDGTEFLCNKSMNGVGISGGGAIRLDGQGAITANIVNAYFANNNDEGGGTPSGGYGGAINMSETPADPSTYVIAQSTFVENSAGRGGAIYFDSRVDGAVLSSIIDNNTSNDEGGAGIYVRAGETAGISKTEFVLWNSSIINNNSSHSDHAGGVHIQQTETSINSSVSSEDDIDLGGNTICGNSSGNAFADYSVREDIDGATGPALRSTEFYGINAIGTGRAYFDIIGEDYSFGCATIASTPAIACAGCTTVDLVAAVCADCPDIVDGTLLVDESSVCDEDDVSVCVTVDLTNDATAIVEFSNDGGTTWTDGTPNAAVPPTQFCAIFTETNTTCASTTTSYQARFKLASLAVATCLEDNQPIAPATVTTTVFPDLNDLVASGDIVLNNNNSCGPSITSCGNLTVTNSFDANGASPDFTSTTTNGGLTFTITNAAAPAACNSINILASYTCAAADIGIVKDDSTPIPNDPTDPDGDDTQTVATGGTATFTVTFTNTSTEPLCNLSISNTGTPDCDITPAEILALVQATGNNDSQLDPLEVVTFTCTLDNVTADLTTSVTINGEGCTTGTTVTATDPTEVVVVTPSIEITKDDSTPGTVDTDGDDTQTIAMNGTADFSITITNSGTEPMCNITVTDALSSDCDLTAVETAALVVAIGNNDNILDPTESFTFTCQEANVPASFTNNAVVNADGCTTGTPVTDNDDTEVVVVNPEITIIKDDSTPIPSDPTDDDGDDTQTVATGGTATFTVVFTNTGDEPLCNLSISNTGTPDCDITPAEILALVQATGNNDSQLDPLEVVTFTCTLDNVTADLTTSVTINGEGCTTGTTVTATDPTEVVVVTPSIEITKDDSTPGTVDTDGDDTQTIAMNGTADFSITITNSGTEPMCNITVTDALSSDCDLTAVETAALVVAIGNNDNILDPTESFTFTCQEANVPASFTNNAVVNADGCTTGTPVTDNDDTEVVVVNPEITIIKDDSTPIPSDPTDDDGDDTQTVATGGTATFTVVFTNTGDEPLCNLSISNTGTPDCDITPAEILALVQATGNNDSQLDPLEVVTFTCTLDNVTADLTTSVTINGEGCTTGTTVTATDPTEVVVVTPSIEITKDDSTPGTVDTDGDDTQTIAMNGTADFSITITNNGTEPMCNITVTDALSSDCDLTAVETAALVAAIGNNDNILDPTESFTFTCQEANVPASFTNNAVVNADGCTTGTPVTDNDDTEVVVIVPGITIIKDDSTPTPNDPTDDDGDDTQTVATGGTATFTVVFTNTTTEPLCNLSISNTGTPDCDITPAEILALVQAVGNNDSQLDQGEIISYTCTLDNVTADLTTSVTINGEGCTTGTTVTATDPTTVIVVTPSIEITKDDSTPGTVDTDGDDTQTIITNGTADFSITITNNGTEPLCNISVTDALSSDCDLTAAETVALVAAIGNNDNNLDPSESFTFTCQEANVPASFINNAIVNADGCTTDTPVTDNDDTEVVVVNPSVEITKDDSTPGTVDTDGDDTQTIITNGTADFSITITNNGTEPLCNISVTDALSSDCDLTAVETAALVAAIGNNDNILDPSESFTFTCQEANVPASFINNAIVNADGCTTDTPVTDNDDTEVIVVTPSIEITKDDSTPGTVDTDGDDTQTIITNGTADFSITITNNGTEPLCNISVTDALSSDCDLTAAETVALVAAIGNNDNNLDPSESFTFTCQEANVPASFINNAIVNADGCTTDTPVTDNDDTEVIVVTPSIEITKDDSTPGTVDTDGDDTQTIITNGTADFSITITNNGTEPLCNISVTDALSSDCDLTAAETVALVAAIGNNDNNLDPSESFTFTCQEANVPASFINNAIVNADGCTTDTPVTDNDDTEVVVVNPSVEITKDDSTPGTVDTDGDDTQTIITNGTADFSITITNNGTEPLCNISVTDALSSDCDLTAAETVALVAAIGNNDNNLDPSESFTFTCQEANVPASFINNAIVNADGCTTDTPVTDNDDTEVVVVNPVITIIKDDSTPIPSDPTDNDGDDTQTVATGGTATFTVVFTNTGTEPLCNLSISNTGTPTCDLTPAEILALVQATGNNDDQLDPLEVVTFTCTLDNVTADLITTVTINGEGCTTGTPITANDPTTVIVVTPSIDVEKDDSTPGTVDTDGDDTQTIIENGTAIFTITVTNNGTEDMCDITISDANSSDCDMTAAQTSVLILGQGNGDNILNPNESFTFTCEENNVPASFTNTAIVSASGCITDTPVTDEDDTEVFIDCPSLTGISGTTELCPEVIGTDLVASGIQSLGDKDIQFVLFNTAQTEASAYDTPDVLLGTVANADVTGGIATLSNPTYPAAIGTYYIYAILNPAPVSPTCRPAPELIFVRSENPTANPTTSAEVCLGTDISLVANPGTEGTTPFSFAWTGPNGFVSTDENPILEFSNAAYPGVGTHTYEVTITSANGTACTSTGTVDVTILEAPEVICRQPVSTFASIGECGNGDLILQDPFVIGDNCGVAAIVNDAPAMFEIGTTVVEWSVEFESGITETCEQEITIADDQAPTIPFCNTAIIMLDDNCMAEVTVNITAEDNCGIATIEGNGTMTFPLGIHAHQVIVTDYSGNEVVHDMTIYVHDTSAPVANCPEEGITVTESELVDFVLPTVPYLDNCDMYSITNNAPAEFEMGITTVTWIGTDTYGNATECVYDVNVIAELTVGNLRPVAASVETESEAATVRWNAPTVNTICEACPTTNYDNFTHIGDYYGHQYFLYTGAPVNWEAANYLANTELNAHLVNIENQAENNFIRYHLPAGEDNLWIGLQGEVSTDGAINLNWTDEMNVEFQNFGDVFALTETQNVVTLQEDGGWAFTDNSTERSFIVERPCINIDQIGPFVEIVNAEGETEEILLTSGAEWAIGEYLATYRADDNCGNESIQSFPVSVDVPQAEYCESAGSEASSLWITQSVIGGNRFNEVEEGGYKDNTDELLELAVSNDEVYIELIAGGNTTNQDLFWRIWLDKNNDGDFFDTDELIVEKTGTNNYLKRYLSADLFGLSATRMRIAVSKYDYPEVCNDFYSGEVEDYLVKNIPVITIDLSTEDSSDNGTGLNDTNVFVTPNPTDTYVNIDLPELQSEANLKIYNTAGQLIKELKLGSELRSHRVDVKDLNEGLYLLEISNGETQVMKKLVVR